MDAIDRIGLGLLITEIFALVLIYSGRIDRIERSQSDIMEKLNEVSK